MTKEDPEKKRPVGRPALPKEKKAAKLRYDSNVEPRLQPESVEINKRFFVAADHLAQIDPEFNLFRFAVAHNFNAPNLSTMRRLPTTKNVPILYHHYLVKDYGVSAHFLLTGEGPIMQS